MITEIKNSFVDHAYPMSILDKNKFINFLINYNKKIVVWSQF